MPGQSSDLIGNPVVSLVCSLSVPAQLGRAIAPHPDSAFQHFGVIELGDRIAGIRRPAVPSCRRPDIDRTPFAEPVHAGNGDLRADISRLCKRMPYRERFRIAPAIIDLGTRSEIRGKNDLRLQGMEY